MKAGIAGGIEAIVRAINANVDNYVVSCVGCRVLRNMTVNNGKH